MRAWTVHPLVVWERLQDAGTLHVDTAFYHEGYVPWQYEWLACQMRERIPGHRGRLPWWAYYEKPDLRWVRHYRPCGQPQVRIELELDPNRAIILPVWAWDVVYCGRFLAEPKSEQEAWEAAMRQAVPDEDQWPLPEPWRGELEASWLRLFDPTLPAWGRTHEGDTTTFSKEVVFETLEIQSVRAVTHFVGSNRHTW